MSNYKHLKLELENFYLSIPTSQSGILWIAVSGGVDSVLLFTLTQELFSENKLGSFSSLGIVHVNHSLRGAESDGDEALVFSLARQESIKKSFHRLVWMPNEKVSQESCRKKREKIYNSLLQQNDFLVFAHHADDLAETIFMRILRGTGIDTLLPMQAIQGNRLRPFLRYDKQMILDTAKEAKICWREDASNTNSKYERNWIRNEIFPELERRRPGFKKRLNALALEATTISLNSALKTPKQFKYKDGIFFYRLKDLRELSTRDIHFLFSVNRDHSFALHHFFRKYSGRYVLPNMELWSSSGLLMRRDLSEKFDVQSVSMEGSCFESILGQWKSNNHAIKLIPYRRGVNSKFKKKFVDQKVPAFFRAGIPLFEHDDNQFVCIPKSFTSSSDIKCAQDLITYSPSFFMIELFTELQFEFG